MEAKTYDCCSFAKYGFGRKAIIRISYSSSLSPPAESFKKGNQVGIQFPM